MLCLSVATSSFTFVATHHLLLVSICDTSDCRPCIPGSRNSCARRMRLRTSSSLITSVMVPLVLLSRVGCDLELLNRFSSQYNKREASNMGYLKKRTVVVDSSERGRSTGQPRTRKWQVRVESSRFGPTRLLNHPPTFGVAPSSVGPLFIDLSLRTNHGHVHIVGHACLTASEITALVGLNGFKRAQRRHTLHSAA